jgi:hypothetical protein
MSEMFLKEIHSAAKNGAKFYVGRNYYGRTRLKIVQGLFGLNTKRFSVAPHELQQIFSALRPHRTAA